jgi:methyltransferase family protein
MLESSRSRVEQMLDDDALVLDVGGWAAPLERADWVIDIQPHSTRGIYGPPPDPSRERFKPESWIVRDICDREPWPFDDGQFDFVVCSHTLEDLRDPVWACSEIARVGRAGYIEVPSRLEEQSLGVHGPWAGWSHHHWLIDVGERSIEFVFKPHLIHARASDHFPARFWPGLSAEQRVSQLWWDGAFEARERLMLNPAELDSYLADFVSANHRSRGPLGRLLRRS